MASAAEKLRYDTLDDFLAIPEGERFHELLSGEIVEKASPVARHGGTQGSAFALLTPFQQRKGRSGGPGGWRFAIETEIRLADHTVVRPDVAGWRRERLPRLPDTFPCLVRPDWVCEILSRSNAVTDLLDKVRIYHQAGVPHYWILDPDRETLRVHRWAEPGYQVVLDVGHHAVVRAEPFDAIEIAVIDLFDQGDEFDQRDEAP